MNAALFRADYKDIQVNVHSDPSNPQLTDVLNAGEATIDGLELDLNLLLTDALTLNARYGYLDAEFNQIENVAGAEVDGRLPLRQQPGALVHGGP